MEHGSIFLPELGLPRGQQVGRLEHRPDGRLHCADEGKDIVSSATDHQVGCRFPEEPQFVQLPWHIGQYAAVLCQQGGPMGVAQAGLKLMHDFGSWWYVAPVIENRIAQQRHVRHVFPRH
jgi:hypothetical protein